MPAPVTTYAPKEVVLQIQDYQLPGLVSISLAWEVPPFTMVRGIRGITTRVKNRNSAATITVETLQTSVANDVLDSIVKQDLATGQAKLNVTLKDLSGRFGIQSRQGFIQARPTVGFSNTSDNRVWVIGLLHVEYIDMLGNSNTLDSLFDRASDRARGIIDSVTGAATDIIDKIL